jgi:hypothetical protein
MTLGKTSLFLNFYLTRVADSDFWQSLIAGNFPRHANVLDGILGFDVAEFPAVAAPNHDCKYMVWVRLVEIQEGGPSLAFAGKSGTHDFAANCSHFSDVILGVRSGYVPGLSLREGWGDQ